MTKKTPKKSIKKSKNVFGTSIKNLNYLVEQCHKKKINSDKIILDDINGKGIEQYRWKSYVNFIYYIAKFYNFIGIKKSIEQTYIMYNLNSENYKNDEKYFYNIMSNKSYNKLAYKMLKDKTYYNKVLAHNKIHNNIKNIWTSYKIHKKYPIIDYEICSVENEIDLKKKYIDMLSSEIIVDDVKIINDIYKKELLIILHNIRNIFSYHSSVDFNTLYANNYTQKIDIHMEKIKILGHYNSSYELNSDTQDKEHIQQDIKYFNDTMILLQKICTNTEDNQEEIVNEIIKMNYMEIFLFYIEVSILTILLNDDELKYRNVYNSNVNYFYDIYIKRFFNDYLYRKNIQKIP
jgi:hypothetical protein